MDAAASTQPSRVSFWDRHGRSFAPLLLLAPSLLFSVFFLVTPMAVLLGYSLSDEVDGETVFTLNNYVRLVTDAYYWEVLFRTVRIAVVTTICALLLGYPAALYLFFSQSAWRRVFLFVVASPLFVSVIVRTYGWIVILSPSGALNWLLPEQLETSLLHTEAAIVIGLMHIYLPFMVLSLNASIYKIDRRLLSAAASLGASNWRIFRDILVPPSLPGVAAGCIFIFSISMTAFSTPVLLGGSSNKTLPFVIYQRNLLLADWHLGSALAFALLIVTLVIVQGLTRFMRRGRLQEALS
jgi:putative spermidine/putrescine transport system permease protein